MDKPGRPLLPPPRLQRYGEPRAIVEPPLRDLAQSRPSEPIDEWAPFKSGKADNVLTDDMTRRAQAAALSSPRVKRLLAMNLDLNRSWLVLNKASRRGYHIVPPSSGGPANAFSNGDV
jgi:hypothetical protein